MDNITKDPAYNAVDPTDFPAMLDVERYGARSTAFDKIISATHDHFWDPLDKKYIDFTQPFDIEKEYLVNPELNSDLKTAIGDKLDESQKIKLVNLDVCGRCPRSCMANRARWRCRPRSATSCATPAPRNTPPTRRARKPATSPASPPISRRAGASRPRSARRWAACSTNWSPRRWSGRSSSACRCWSKGLAMGAFATFFKESRDPL